VETKIVIFIVYTSIHTGMAMPALVAEIMVCTEEICNRSRMGLVAHGQNTCSGYGVAVLSCHDNQTMTLCYVTVVLFMLFPLKRRESIGRERLTTLSHRALMSRGPTNLRLRAKCGQGHGRQSAFRQKDVAGRYEPIALWQQRSATGHWLISGRQWTCAFKVNKMEAMMKNSGDTDRSNCASRYVILE